MIVFAIIILIIVGLLVWAVDYLPVTAPPANIVKFLLIVLGVLLIADRAGIL